MISALLAWVFRQRSQAGGRNRSLPRLTPAGGAPTSESLEVKIANQVVSAIQMTLTAETSGRAGEVGKRNSRRRAIFAGKELGRGQQSENFLSSFRQCVERETLTRIASERAAILGRLLKRIVSVNSEQQIASTESLKEPVLLLTARIEAMKGKWLN